MKNYLNYVNEVLGVHTIMQSQGLPLKASEITMPAFFYTEQGPLLIDFSQKWDLVFINWKQKDSDSLFAYENKELFSKMLTAMKLENKNILILDCILNEKSIIANELLKHCQTDHVLFFTHEPISKGELQIKGSVLWLETFSPALLVQNPTLKKQVWNDLQKMMKECANF